MLEIILFGIIGMTIEAPTVYWITYAISIVVWTAMSVLKIIKLKIKKQKDKLIEEILWEMIEDA